MPLKPSDIEQKTFSTALRGYDLNEVDDFLDEVISTIRDLEEKVAAGKGSGSNTQPAAAVPDEGAVGRVLIAAQKAADELLAEAREEAEKIREDARGDAEVWLAERDQKKAEAEQEMAELRLRVDNVRRELAVLATVVADGLDEMDSSIASGTRGATQMAEDVTFEEEGSSSVDSDDEADSEDSADSPDELVDETDETGDEATETDVAEAADETMEVEDESAEDDDDIRGSHELDMTDVEIELDDTAVRAD